MSEASKRILWQMEYEKREHVGRVLNFKLCPKFWLVTAKAKPFHVELDDE